MTTPNELAQGIIDWFESYQLENGIEPLLEARQQLSINCTKIANYVKQEEAKHKRIYQERRIAEARTKIETEGTTVHKEATSIIENKDLRLKEAESEGNARGAKIVLDSYYKVLDAMASIINTLNR